MPKRTNPRQQIIALLMKMNEGVLAAELNDHQTAAISDDGSAELAADVLMTSASAGCLATR